MSPSQALRLLITNAKLPKKFYSGVDPSAARAWAELQRQGNNLNQIARWFNTNRVREISSEDTRRIGGVVHRVERLLQQVRHEILTVRQS
jgi:hypothetical protein